MRMLPKAQMRVALVLISMLLLAGCATPLHNAARAGDLQRVNQLIAEGSDVNAIGGMGKRTPMHSAAESGKMEVIMALIKAGADINSKEQMLNSTPLHFAAMYDRTEAAIALIKAGADVNASDMYNHPILNYTSRNDSPEIAIALIKAGADVNARGMHNWTPLHGMAHQGRTEIAIALIKAGADTSIRTKKGKTFIDIARGEKQIQFIQDVEREIQNFKAARLKQQEEERALRKEQKAEQLRLEQARKEEDNRAFKSAGIAGTVDSWSDYLKTNPSGSHRAEALKDLAALLEESGDTALALSMARNYPGLIDHLPLKYSLAFIGPPGLTVADVIEIKKQGMSDRLIAAQIRSMGAAYKKFSLQEIMSLNKMGLSDEIVEAMIDSTTKAREAAAQADYKKELESLNAEQRAELEEISRKMDQMQKAQATTVSVSSTQGAGGADASNCVAREGAVLLCKQTTGGLLQMVCVSAAKAKFPCN